MSFHSIPWALNQVLEMKTREKKGKKEGRREYQFVKGPIRSISSNESTLQKYEQSQPLTLPPVPPALGGPGCHVFRSASTEGLYRLMGRETQNNTVK